MKFLVIGNGGREHALAWKLLQSPQVTKVICAPGNGGTATMEGCENQAISVDDFEAIARLAIAEEIALVVVGPEVPLALGITDYLTKQNIKVFGPTQAGAQIEASKSWAKDLMTQAGVATAQSATFFSQGAAQAYVEQQGAPIVIKADGLAAGKGVTVATTLEEAQGAVEACFQSDFDTVVIEEYLTGQEVSVLTLTDGLDFVTLLPSQDHKQVGEGDTGANTGGMGAYAPTPVVNPQLMERIETEIVQPILTTLRQKGIDYRGVLYTGLMITPQGEPMVLEFNCRFGDPETQAVLSLLETPLEELMFACVNQNLAQLAPISWHSGSAVCVVATSSGYPGSYQKGFVIEGIESAQASGAIVFHGGTKQQQSNLVTDGGRVLGITAVGDDFDQAITQAYQATAQIQFEGIYYRKDIGHRVKPKSI